MRVRGFDWDEHNEPKLEKHGLDRDDVEYLFEYGDPLFSKHDKVDGRFYALGFIPDSRFVAVVFEYDAALGWVRVITAYEPTSDAYWRAYERKKIRGKQGCS